MATSLEELEKEVEIDHLRTNNYHLVQRVRKSVQLILKIICLRAIIKKEKKKEINANKIYSPVGKLDEQAKKANGCSVYIHTVRFWWLSGNN